MKKIILIALIALLPSALFSYEISFNKKFSKTVTPDLLTTHVNVNVEDKDELFINEKIEVFNKYIKSNSKVTKKNGTFTLSPKYRYYKDKQEFTGYVGSLRYEVKSKNAKVLNDFLASLISLKQEADSRKVKLNISNISWITSEQLYTNNLDELRIGAITWIESYSNSLTATLAKDCQVKKISISDNNRDNFLRANTMAYSAKSSSHVAPIRSNKEISINPNFVLECK